MKTPLILLFVVAAALSGCISTGPAISKSRMGNLEVYVVAPDGLDVRAARISVDGIFVGNISNDLPVLYLKRGKHLITVELPGMKVYEQEIMILGDPNHQFLDVNLEKK